MAQPVTLADVARHAGVSLATASRVVNGSTRVVGESLREKVLASATALRYEANPAAQAIVRGHLDVVGLVVPDIEDPYFSAIAASLMARAEENGLMVALTSTGRQADREVEYVAALRRHRARALVVVGSRTTDTEHQARLQTELQELVDRGGRVALVSQRRLPFDTVAIENRAGARSLAEALVGLGYRRFAALAGPDSLLTSTDRITGFRSGLAGAATLPQENVGVEEFTRDGGYRAMTTLLGRRRSGALPGEGPLCVFAVNDVMAVGAMSAVRDAGLEPGRDVALAGFDDIATLRDVSPRLTTVRVDLARLGREALDLTLGPLPDKPRTRRVKCEVVLGGSTPAVGQSPLRPR
ncbi:LacI family DNA-binding transcriptional regulator [Nocardioides bruguierae]|uniref:LacI family transcriptional regulator n=1 Tax=Nocardioides bruguierae TaxID=2945102 RepID=A0A9X2DBA5_9ACTN|nr:LacI family DNA-binding transcriptional regulator [Nocardioides bruguierae]MCM0622767.1 LacI family transcriptional regulator [Nocardioides bruguierae]